MSRHRISRAFGMLVPAILAAWIVNAAIVLALGHAAGLLWRACPTPSAIEAPR